MTGADATLVHVATLRGELWSPLCTTEAGWVVPLADRNYIEQVTCQNCLGFAVIGASGPVERLLSQQDESTTMLRRAVELLRVGARFRHAPVGVRRRRA